MLTCLDSHRADTKLIMSDLNFGNVYCKYPVLSPKPLDNLAPELFCSHDFKQLIDIPTRVTDKTVSLIDLIFTNNVDNIQSHGTLSPIADHEGIFVTFHCVQAKSKTITKTVYDFKNIDEISLRNYIKSFDFESNIFSKPIDQQAILMTNFLSATQKSLLKKNKL